MKTLLNKSDEQTRRGIVAGLASGLLGMQYSTAVRAASSGTAGASFGGQAKSLIFLDATGGMSQVDSFDIKEANKEANDNCQPIKTSADGIRVGQFFPNMSKQMHHFALINSMHHTQGVHHFGQYLNRTGYVKRATVEHPELGAWISKLGERRSGDIPPYVKIGKTTGGSGFLSSRYGALPIPDPVKGMQKAEIPVPDRQQSKRLNILNQLNAEFEQKLNSQLVKDYHIAYEDAMSLLKSEDLDVFDLSQESAKTKAFYGENPFGYSCLLARRLVEKGVGCIYLNHHGWDHHTLIYKNFAPLAESLDQGVAALISDLESRGLLDSTIFAFTTEFGRDAKLAGGGGRGHNPAGYTCMLAGGGIKGGQKYGATDKTGQRAEKDKVSVGDYHATIAQALGVPHDTVVMSSQGRPFKIGNKSGKPIKALF